MVGGSTGGDTNLVAFRARNDERVTVETQDDIRTGKYFGGGAPVYNHFVFQNDERDIIAANGTRAGRAQFVKLNRQFSRRR